MHHYPPVIQNLIQRLSYLPTIGPKTAERIVFALLKKDRQLIRKLGNEITELSNQIVQCETCYTFSETNPCDICNNTQRDKTLLCVVTEPQDIAAIERTGHFHGLYFVIGGTISTYHGTSPKDLRMPELLKRIKETPTLTEVILAIDPTAEGETTTLYVSEQLKNLGKKITRLARGLPVGADVEYADEVTLSAAIDDRKQIN
ncbi:MAG: recombination mediator RecR [Patescibacteria group bacterium]